MTLQYQNPHLTDKQQIIALAQELHSETLQIDDNAEVRQEQGGYYVAAWVWIENACIEDGS
jgi:hypothetical protein